MKVAKKQNSLFPKYTKILFGEVIEEKGPEYSRSHKKISWFYLFFHITLYIRENEIFKSERIDHAKHLLST